MSEEGLTQDMSACRAGTGLGSPEGPEPSGLGASRAIPSAGAAAASEVLREALEAAADELDKAAWHIRTIASDIRNPGQKAWADKWQSEAHDAGATARAAAAKAQGDA